MNKLFCIVGALVVLSFGGVAELQAQRAGPGGVLDWIHKMSGPGFLSAGYAVFLWPVESTADSLNRDRLDTSELNRIAWGGWSGLGFELGQTWGHSNNLHGAQGEADSLKIATINVGLSYLILRHRLFSAGLRGGVTFQDFRVEDVRSSNQSYSLQVVLHAFPDVALVRSSFVLYPVVRVAVGGSSFGAFPVDPFGPIDTDVSIDSRELALTGSFQLGLAVLLR